MGGLLSGGLLERTKVLTILHGTVKNIIMVKNIIRGPGLVLYVVFVYEDLGFRVTD